MKRICLIQCAGGETGKADAPPLSTYNVAEPLGLLCLDAWLRHHGHDVLLLHPHLEPDACLSETELVRRATSYRPDFVGFSAMTNQVPATARVATRLREIMPRVPVIVGGDHFSSCPHDLAYFEMFDFAVCGEGEPALAWLLDNASLSPALRTPALPGIYWLESGTVHGSGRTQRITNISALPPPSRYPGLLHWGEVGMLMWPPQSLQTGMMSLYASRGCPYSCSYCNARLVWGKGMHWRHPTCVVEEMREVRDRHGINTAFFVDLTFNADMEQAHLLCEALSAANLGISWYVLARPGNPQDRIRVDRPLLEAMRRAGCVKVGFGVETVSPTVARSLRRAKCGEYVIQLARWMDELGMISKAFLLMGHSAEDDDYYGYLRDYLDELNADEIRISFLTPFPGTQLWETHRDELPDWPDYGRFTTFRPILPHPAFTPAQLEMVRFNLLRRFYFSRRYARRVEAKICAHPHLKESFDVFQESIHNELSLASNEVANQRRLQTNNPAGNAYGAVFSY